LVVADLQQLLHVVLEDEFIIRRRHFDLKGLRII
jgi:hypothetical protein